MSLCTNRPEAAAIGGSVWVFVGGAYQTMTVAAAKVLREKLDTAILAAEDVAQDEP